LLDLRGQLLRAAIGFAGCAMPSYDRALHALRTWLDTWSGIGHVTIGRARQGYDLQLTRYDEKGLASDLLYDQRGAFSHCHQLFSVSGSAPELLRVIFR
jgi:hypothetical protein